jgi:hypothetical protein
MENEIVKIEDELYNDKLEPKDLIQETNTLLEKINDDFTDKVVQIVIKGQIDGN